MSLDSVINVLPVPKSLVSPYLEYLQWDDVISDRDGADMLRQLTLSGASRRTDRETVWGAILVLLLGLFAAAYLPAMPSADAVEVEHGLSDIPKAAPVGPASFSHITARGAGASSSGFYVDYPVLDMHPNVWSEDVLSDRQIAGRIEQLPTATLVIVGDMMLGRQVTIEMFERDDFSWPFRQTIDLLESADLTFGNLESPIVSGCPFSSDGMVFCAVPRAVEGLAWAGIDAVSLANNHAYTYGDSGFNETVDYLRQAGIEPIPAGMLTLRQVDGIRIGILAFDDSNAKLDVEQATAIIGESASRVDILIGLMHWGIEYQAEPTERQREVGYALADAGMDVIVGTHPHRIQPAEEYRGKLIVYSLGNFVFDQMWWEETRLGEIVRLELVKTSDGVTVSHEMIPIQIFDYGQPVVMEHGR